MGGKDKGKKGKRKKLERKKKEGGERKAKLEWKVRIRKDREGGI